MENRTKTLAQKEANFLSHEHIDINLVSSTSSSILEAISIEQDFENLLSLLDEKPCHKDTIIRQYLEDLSVQEESEKYNIPIVEVTRRRSSAKRYISRKLKRSN